MPIIQVEKLCKRYGRHEVLQNIDLSIEPGRLVGFLGPNGAGKTTTIRVLLGLLRATAGSAKINGLDCYWSGNVIRKQVGYLPGDVHLYPNLTGQQTLEFMQRVRGSDCQAEIRRLSRVFDLELNRIVRKYSTGMRQKLGLIQALMHRPDVLILDEPTSALDPLVRTEVFAELRETVDRGQTVLFSSHSLDEVEQLCDEVIILRSGEIVEQQKIEVLKQRALRRVQVTFGANQAVPQDRPVELENIVVEGRQLHGTWHGQISILLDWLQPMNIEDLIVERPDLNDLFMTYYSEGQSGSS